MDLPGREHGRRERVRDPRRAHLCDAWLDRARHELPPAGGGPGPRDRARGPTLSAAFAKFSREDERAADHAAVRYTTAAGIDPDGLVEMFRILQRVQSTDPGAIEQFFASHPMTADRITDVQQTIAADPAARTARTGKQDAPLIHELQRAVRALPPPPPPPKTQKGQ